MSPLPAADTSSQESRPGAPADPPTGRTKPRAKRTKRSTGGQPSAKPAATALDAALGTSMRPFTSRAADDLLDALRDRADAIAAALPPEARTGGPGGVMRLVITDALLHALELAPEDHAQRVHATRGRELIAQAVAKAG